MSRWMRPSLPVRALVHLVAYVVALTMLVPFAWMVLTSLKTNIEALGRDLSILPAGPVLEWQWGNFLKAWRDAQLGEFYMNSIIAAVAVTVLSVIYNAMAGFAFAKLSFAGRRITFVLTLVTMLLPVQVYFIFMYVLCGWLGYVDSLQALIVPFLANAFGVFYMRQTIVSVPDSLIHAGRIDGMNDLEVFLHVIVPSVRSGLAALAIFTFMSSWNNFFWPLVVIDSEESVTLPLAVARLSAGYYVPSWPVQMAAATIITVPTIIVFLVFQRQFVQGLSLSGVRG